VACRIYILVVARDESPPDVVAPHGPLFWAVTVLCEQSRMSRTTAQATVVAHAAGEVELGKGVELLSRFCSEIAEIWRMRVCAGAISSSRSVTGSSEPSLPCTTASKVS
jgi:hypothetical protein